MLSSVWVFLRKRCNCGRYPRRCCSSNPVEFGRSTEVRLVETRCGYVSPQVRPIIGLVSMGDTERRNFRI